MANAEKPKLVGLRKLIKLYKDGRLQGANIMIGVNLGSRFGFEDGYYALLYDSSKRRLIMKKVILGKDFIGLIKLRKSGSRSSGVSLKKVFDNLGIDVESVDYVLLRIYDDRIEIEPFEVEGEEIKKEVR